MQAIASFFPDTSADPSQKPSTQLTEAKRQRIVHKVCMYTKATEICVKSSGELDDLQEAHQWPTQKGLSTQHLAVASHNPVRRFC